VIDPNKYSLGKMKKIKNIILILLIPIIIILTNFSLLAFNQDYYEEQYTKNGIYNKIPKEQVDEATRQLISYLRNGNEIRGDYFNEKEKQHLRDVRQIIKTLIIALYISILFAAIIIIAGLIKDKKALGMALIAGGLLTTLLIVALFFLLTNFENTFIKFHEILFNNNLWMLNPETDKLIVMFPENFFYDITKSIAIRSLITAITTTLLGVFLFYYKRLNKTFK